MGRPGLKPAGPCLGDPKGSAARLDGGGSQTIHVAVAGKNGFAGPVSVELSGLPPSAASYPAAPLTVELGHPVAIQIFVPPTAPAGTDTLSLGNGPHQVVVEAVDVDGRTATFRRTQLLVSN